VEFAIVSAVFIPLCLAILQIGVLMWAEGTMQSTAAQVARCAAIASPNCTGSTNTNTTFAASTWEQWIFSQITSAMTVTPTAAVCVSSIPSEKITITCTYWNWLINPFVNGGKTAAITTLTATAYFPSSSTSC